MIHPDTELRPVDPRVGMGVVATTGIPKGTITWVRDELDRTFSQRQVDQLHDLFRPTFQKYAFQRRHWNFYQCRSGAPVVVVGVCHRPGHWLGLHGDARLDLLLGVVRSLARRAARTGLAHDGSHGGEHGDCVWTAGGVRCGAIPQRASRHPRYHLCALGDRRRNGGRNLSLLDGPRRRRLSRGLCVRLLAGNRIWRAAPVRPAALSVLVPASAAGTRERLEQILHRHSDRTVLTSQRKSPDSRDIFSYRLRLRDPSRRDELRSELATTGDIQELRTFSRRMSPNLDGGPCPPHFSLTKQ